MKKISILYILLVLLIFGCARGYRTTVPITAVSQDRESRYFWDIYKKHKVSPYNQALLKHQEMIKTLEDIRKDHPAVFKIKEVGKSVEGRSINLVTFGSGPVKILLWSQMHGDEPTATCALLDILNYFNKNLQHQIVKKIMKRATILMVPMLNPDGAERFTRRNAQDIDINRDARYLQSPESRILKNLQEEYQPDFGFNLHDQNPRRMAGKTGNIVAISLMAPPYDYEDNDNEVKIRAKKIAALFYQSIAPFAYGRVTKYDADYMPRSFGDSMQSWGVSTVLVESGGWEDMDRSILVRINFTGLLTVFHAIASETYVEANPTLYDALRLSGEHNLFDLKLSGVTIVNGLNMPPFVGDIGINFSIQQTPSGPVVTRANITDIGDLRVTNGKRNIDCSELVAVPGFVMFDKEIKPGRILSESKAKSYLKQGITTVIGSVDLDDHDQVEELERIDEKKLLGVNLGFIGNANSFSAAGPDVSKEDLVFTLSRPLLGISIQKVDSLLQKYAKWLNLRMFSEDTIQTKNIRKSVKLNDIPLLTSKSAQIFGLEKRGIIKRGALADLLLFEKKEQFTQDGILNFDDLTYIIFNGRIVFQDGRFLNIPQGKIISR
ncbi:M14 family zinc carboxypeptidase [candidate division KSB1 bacterium]